MENPRLYLSLKNKICERIYKGLYQDGETIPPERTLAETFEVSRVTVRKALDLLENEGIIERTQGSGTVVRLKHAGHKGSLDIIALLAPAQKPFFSLFIDHFQRNAEKNDSLVLFKQNPAGEKVEDCLFKLFQKDIRNVVLWLDDLKIDIESLRRLRGLGMNMVFFDTGIVSPYADCVLLDNQNAITTLFDYLVKKGAKDIVYVGWDNFSHTSVSERENAFRALNPNHKLLGHIKWGEKESFSGDIKKYIDLIKNQAVLPDGVICGDGEIGIAVKKAFLTQGLHKIEVVSPDDYPESTTLSLSTYRQPFDELAQKVYTCLLEQNTHSKKWKAKIYPITGQLIVR
jgi:DNA-binding LacI/PurR family transcriptional regulator